MASAINEVEFSLTEQMLTPVRPETGLENDQYLNLCSDNSVESDAYNAICTWHLLIFTNNKIKC
jgi:hypothetical protein